MKKLVFQSHFLVQIFWVDDVNNWKETFCGKCWYLTFLSHKQRQNSLKTHTHTHTINETTFVHSVYAFRLNSSFYEILFCPQTTKFLNGKTDNLIYVLQISKIKIVFPRVLHSIKHWNLIGTFFENLGAQTSQVLDSDPHPLHVALDAGVVEDREGAGGEGQVDNLQHQQTWTMVTGRGGRWNGQWYWKHIHWRWAMVFNGSQPLAKNSIALVTTHRSGVYIATRTPESHSKSQVWAEQGRESRRARRGNLLGLSRCFSSFSCSRNQHSDLW